MKTILVTVCAALLVHSGRCGMTEAQMKSAAKLMRNVCQPKTKVTSAQIEAMHQGTFSQEKEILSYMECILRTGQILKDGKLNYDAVKKQMMNLPDTMLASALATLENCKDSMKSNDKYQAAYEFYICFYEDNPSNFFLP